MVARKKECAQAIWQKFYVEGGYDARFVAGLIGNMFGEGQCGQLQYADWNQPWNVNNLCQSGKVISNIEQARVACLLSTKDYGIGMVQWSII
ncbi:MAG: phage tail tip lysozyme [Lachnospiraceae bacterium]